MSKHSILISTLILFLSLSTYSQTKEELDAYITRFRNIAMQDMVKYKIPASITLAQGIIETNCGKSSLATEANNHFGIKCHEWTGDSYFHDDDRKHECFRNYESAEESYEDHAIFLTTRPRYSKLFQLDISDYKGWANGLKTAGYATNPKYAQILIKTIEDNELYKYDEFVLGEITEDELYNNSHYINSKEIKEIKYSDSDEKRYKNGKLLTFDLGQCECMNESKFVEVYSGRSIYSYNNVFATFIGKHDKLEYIARDLKIPMRKLLKYNDLPKQAIADYEDIIYLDYKNRKGSEKYHIVKNNDETLWSISQCYTVTVSTLQRKNNIEEINEPIKVGTKILLR